MKDHWSIGHELGVKAAHNNPQITYGLPDMPPFKGTVKNRNLIAYGFCHGFRSIANERLPS